jgi:hypothetical protein
MIPTFEHAAIMPHPLKSGVYMVLVTSISGVPPYFGTLKQCIKAATAANHHAAKLLGL